MVSFALKGFSQKVHFFKWEKAPRNSKLMGNISSGPIYKSFQMDFRFLSFNLVLWKDTMEEILEFVLREASLAMFLIYLSWITDV